MQIPIGHKLGADGDALARLIAGDIPTDEEQRWNMIDGPRFRIQTLLEDHNRAKQIVQECRDTGGPFCLFLRNFSAEANKQIFTTESSVFQGWLLRQLSPRSIPIVRLHGGSDALIPVIGVGPRGPVRDKTSGVLSTHSENWLPIVTELIGAASIVVVLISDLTEGVLQEIELVRSCGQQDRCLIVILDPTRTPGDKTMSREEVRAQFADFPHVHLKPDTPGNVASSLEMWAGNDALDRIIDDRRTGGALENALGAKFGYLEPDVFSSANYRSAIKFIWTQMRLMRVVFHDAYWGSLKEIGITRGPLAMGREWITLHKLYGLAVAFGDFNAVTESLIHLAKLYHLRHSLYGFNLTALAKKFNGFAEQMDDSYRLDTESRFLDEPDPFAKTPKTLERALNLFSYAQKLESKGDLQGAGIMYQLSFVCALESSDQEETVRLRSMSGILHDWAKFQAGSGVLDWAVLNYRHSLGILENLASNDPESFLPDVALHMNNLGSTYFKINEFGLAEQMFSRALEIRRERTGDNPEHLSDLGTSLMNLGMVKARLKEYEAARSLYSEALEVWKQRATLDPSGVVQLTYQQILTSAFLARYGGDPVGARAIAKEAEMNLDSVRSFDTATAKQYETDLAQVWAELEK